MRRVLVPFLALIWSLHTSLAQNHLLNPSFEDAPLLLPGQSPVASGQQKSLSNIESRTSDILGIPHWVNSFTDVGLGAGIRNAGLSRLDFNGSGSTQYAFITSGEMRLSQVTPLTLDANTTYDARIKVAMPGPNRAGKFQLWAGLLSSANPDEFTPKRILLAEVLVATPDWTGAAPDVSATPGTWTDLRITFTPPSAVIFLGRRLAVSFQALQGSSGPLYWDDASLTTAPAPARRTLRVKGDLTTGAQDGTSWANAFRGPTALQDALDAARPIADTGQSVEVWVAAGDYLPSRTLPGQETDPRARTFEMSRRIAIIGGFAGTETSADQADPARSATRLVSATQSGVRGQHNVVTAGRPADASAMLRNLTLAGGDYQYSFSAGNGLSVLGGMPSLNRCEFRGAGPSEEFRYSHGTMLKAGAVNVSDCRFFVNAADGFGGGVLVEDAFALFHQCVFTCQAVSGPAARVEPQSAGKVLFQACSFQDNDGDGSGACSGAADYLDCEFNGNEATTAGAVRGARNVLRCRFERNRSWYGNGGAVLGASHVSQCVFLGNRSGAGGGGVSGVSVITNSVFIANRAVLTGGATAASISNCLFVGNVASQSQTQEEAQFSTSSIDHSIVQGWTGALGGSGNRDVPSTSLFLDEDGPNNIPGDADDDLRPIAGSVMTDAGNSLAVIPDVLDLDDDGDTLEPLPLDYVAQPRLIDDPFVSNPNGVPLPGTNRVVDIGPYEGTFSVRHWQGNSGGLLAASSWTGGTPGPNDPVIFDRDPAGPGAAISAPISATTGDARFQGGQWTISHQGGAAQWRANGSDGIVIGPVAARPTRLTLDIETTDADQILIDAAGYLVAGRPGSQGATLRGRVSNLGTIELPGNAQSFGSLIIDGEYEQSFVQGGRLQSGTLNLSVGMRNGAFTGDRIDITGVARLGGKLELSILSGPNEPPLPTGIPLTIISAPAGIDMGPDQHGFDLLQVPLVDGDRLLIPRYETDAQGRVVSVNVVVADLLSILGFGESGSQPVNANNRPNRVVVGDFDGRDGDDVAVAVSQGTSTPGLVFIFYSQHRDGIDWPGFFQPASPVSIVPVGLDPVDMDRGNMDGLDFDDLVVANRSSQNLTVLLSRVDSASNSGFFEQAHDSPVALRESDGTALTPVSLCAADFIHPLGDPDRDDVVVGVARRGILSPALLLYRNSNAASAGLSRFPAAESRVALEEEPISTTPTDGDGDKPIDIAAVFAESSQARVFLNATLIGSDFRTGPVIPVGAGSRVVQGRVRRTPGVRWPGRTDILDSFLDLNRDGKADLITVDASAGRISAILNATTSFVSYNSALAIEVTPDGGDTVLNPQAVTAVDLDLDGDTDLAVLAASPIQPLVAYQIRNDLTGATPVFPSVQEIPGVEGVPLLIASGDVDLDGRNDVVLVTEGTGLQQNTALVARRNGTDDPRCHADCDDDGDYLNGGRPDGAVTIDDILYYLTAFERGDPVADLTDAQGTQLPDQAVTIDDLLYFLVRFEEGC